jgi:hypothetical protein
MTRLDGLRRDARRALRSDPVLMLALLLGVAYLLLLLVRFRGLAAAENWNSDSASIYLIPQDLTSLSHVGHVVMSTSGYWVQVWLGVLTSWLPGHRALWEAGPYLLNAAAALLIGWAVARVASRRAAALAVLLILAASPDTLVNFSMPSWHNTVNLGTAALGAYLVWAVTTRRSASVQAGVMAVVALVAGACLASDLLLAPAGLLPFAVAGLTVALVAPPATIGRRGLLLVTVVGSLATELVALATNALMRALDFTHVQPIGYPQSLAAVGNHARWLVQGLLRMGNGLSIAPHGSTRPVLLVLCAAVTVVGVLAVPAIAWLAVTRARRPERSPQQDGRAAHCTFWVASLLATVAAYLFVPVTAVPSDRYFINAVPAVAAVVCLPGRGRRVAPAVAALASVFMLGSLVGLVKRDAQRNVAATIGPVVKPYGGQIARFISAQRATIGYTGYFDAASLRWSTHGSVAVYPVQACAQGLCPFYLNRIDGWYRPHGARRSFLIASAADQFVQSPPPAWGRPAQTATFGQVVVYIWNHDVTPLLGLPVAT